jgi:hypothetical protein
VSHPNHFSSSIQVKGFPDSLSKPFATCIVCFIEEQS